MPQLNEIDSLESYRDCLQAVAILPGHADQFFFRDWYMCDFHPQGHRILDLGGYVGATATHYGRLGFEVTSVEGADAYCTRFRENTADLPTVRLVQGLIEDFDEPNSYDACCCTEILNHVMDPLRVLEVAHRCLVPGGLMFLANPSGHMRVERRLYSLDELYMLMQAAGFHHITAYHKDCSPQANQNIVMGYK